MMQAEPPDLVKPLLELTNRARRRAAVDPFGNAVLAVALAISRRLDEGEITGPAVEALVRRLRDDAFDARAWRLARYVGGTDAHQALQHLRAVAAAAFPASASWDAARVAVERPRFAAVFTAHPTFALPADVYAALAEAASGQVPIKRFASHRPGKPGLAQEFTQAVAAITRGRDAIDTLNGALLDQARATHPARWTELVPCPVILASWVGYDTDGRADICWFDTFRLRLRMKWLQLARLRGQVDRAAPVLAARLDRAVAAVERQIAACPEKSCAEATAGFAQQLVATGDAALLTTAELRQCFAAAIAEAGTVEARRQLLIARAGLVGHGLALAHTHVRLNATQIHNAVRLRLGLEQPAADPFRRRVLLNTINAALDGVQPVPVDFGAILGEQASATQLMMNVAQIVKHVDRETPVRFLIAETESGYTLLGALWLARLFGVADHIEISPLFETAEALEGGTRVIEEALRSPHYRAYVQAHGRIALQFGYSDSGRYVGQLAATYLIERLRVKIAAALTRHGIVDVEVVLFDTHGESIGRGAHPGSLADRLAYLSPDWPRRELAQAGLRWREESAFQGGDGYLLFGTPELALATITGIARHVFGAPADIPDPIYRDPDFAADFFATVGAAMGDLVEDPGYASLLGAFGPALLDATGSRPAARQQDGMGVARSIRHPRELRAIPNNAILQQLGWCANTLQGVGTAASRQPEAFAEFRDSSPRFRRAFDFVSHALQHSDLDVLRATVALLDPGMWLDRAAHARKPGRADALVRVARALEQLDLWAPAQAMARRIQADHLALRAACPDMPHMADAELLLHALRLAIIQRIWLLATAIPDFSPRHGLTRDGLDMMILRLEIPAALDFLASVFPDEPDPAADRDYAEPRAPRSARSYAREHAVIFEPMRQLFELVREIGTAIAHRVGAFG